MLINPRQYALMNAFWLENGGTPKSPAADALKTLEEVVEMCFACGATQNQIGDVVANEIFKALKRNENYGIYNPSSAASEFGDVVVCLTVLAQKYGFTEADVEATLDRIAERQWTPDKDGVLRRPRYPNK